MFRAVILILLATSVSAEAQYYRGYNHYAYSYPGRGYYSGGGHYSEHYGTHYAPRSYSRPSYAPSGNYRWYGGPPSAYLGGRGGGWGGEW